MNVLCPLRGGKPGEAEEYINDCTGGLAPGSDDTTTWADRTVQETFALSCVLLKCSFPVSSQHWKLSTSEEARSQDPLHWTHCSPLAFSRYVSASLILGGRSKHQVYSSSQVTYSLCCKTKCWAAVMAADTRFPSCLPRCQSQKGSQRWSRHFPAEASLFDWGGGSREETKTFSTGRWAHAPKA